MVCWRRMRGAGWLTSRLTELRLRSKSQRRRLHESFRLGLDGIEIELHDLAVALALEHRRVIAQQLPSPPESLFALGIHVGEPVAIEHRADLLRRRSPEWICGKQVQNIRLIQQELLLGEQNEAVCPPRAERREPEVPFKPRLIRRVNPRRPIQILRV